MISLRGQQLLETRQRNRARIRSTRQSLESILVSAKNGAPAGVREVQRALHFSSPSIAFHHLEQLRELGLVEKQEVGGHYVLVGQVKIGVLKHYVKLGKLLFPRYFFYALFSTLFYGLYLALMVHSFTRDNLFIIIFGAIVSGIFWYEAYRIWGMRPF
jgi:hypothetical protein